MSLDPEVYGQAIRVGGYDLFRISVYRMTPEELWAARRLRQFQARALRRLRWRLACRYYIVTGGIGLLMVEAAATVILLAGRATPEPNLAVVLVAGAAGTVLMLGVATSKELNRWLHSRKRELDTVTDELEMHRDTIRVLGRHLKRHEQLETGGSAVTIRTVLGAGLRISLRVLAGAFGAFITASGFVGLTREPEEFRMFVLVLLGTCAGMGVAAGVKGRRRKTAGAGLLFASGVCGAILLNSVVAAPSGVRTMAWYIGYTLSIGMYTALGLVLVVAAVRGIHRRSTSATPSKPRRSP